MTQPQCSGQLVLKITDRTGNAPDKFLPAHRSHRAAAKIRRTGKRLQILAARRLRQREILVFQSRHLHRSTTE